MGLAFMSHCHFNFFLCEKQAFMVWWDLVMAICNLLLLPFLFCFFFFFSLCGKWASVRNGPSWLDGIWWWPFIILFFSPDEKVILYNILLLFGGPLISGGLRQWPKWPIALANPKTILRKFWYHFNGKYKKGQNN